MTRIEQLQAPCLQDLVRWASEKPDAPAMLAPGQAAVSFQLLVAKIGAVAELLRSAGVRPGDVVAVAMPDGPGYLTASLGAVEAAAAAPLDWQLTEAEFRSRLTLLRACLLLTSSATGGHAAAVARTLGIPVVEFGSGAAPKVSRDPSRAPQDCALVLQTSATTGEPKLVPLTHTNLHAICAGVHRGLALHAEDRYLSIMPLHHILGFSSALGQLMAGGSVACTGFDAQRFREWMEELSPTWYAAGPALHRAILDIAKQDPGPFRRAPLRFVRCGSGAGSPELLSDIERVLRVKVVNGYGLTEVGPVTNTPPELPRKIGSVGRTIGPELAIMDARGNLVTPGAEGEVVVRGDAVMAGYLDDEKANRETFLNGWFRTGDLGRLDEEGDLFITGRIKEIINRGGETISPLEIDLAMGEHPGIFRVASFGVAHPTLGEDVVAAVVLRPGVRAAASDIRSFLSERLSRSKVPGRIWFVESIPSSASGKPLRDTLRTRFQASSPVASKESSVCEDESSALLRRRIAAVWMDILHSDLPGPEDNFFAMGGDSLSAARLFALLAAEFQLTEAALELGKFLDSPTFLELVKVVARSASPSNDLAGEPAEMRFENVSVVCLQPSGDAAPLFFFPGEAIEPWSLRHLVRSLGAQQPFFALRHQLSDPAEFPDIAGRFVTLISRIQPNGPIVLAGHCYGGILAYEVAQRMIAQLPKAARVTVVLVDVAAPGYPKARASSYLAHLPAALGTVLRGEGRKLVGDLAEHFRFVRARTSEQKRARQELSAAQSAAPENVPVPRPGLSPGAVILRTYAPQPFPGALANVMAGGGEVSERVLEDSRKGWRELARGPYRECSVLGCHNSIFDADNAGTLANFIQSCNQKQINGT